MATHEKSIPIFTLKIALFSLMKKKKIIHLKQKFFD